MRRWRCRREEAVRLALRTQQVIAYETGVADPVDPLGGRYCRALTDKIEGGRGRISSRSTRWAGRWRRLSRASSAVRFGGGYQYQRAVERGDQVIVGVNKFTMDGEVKPELLRVDPAVEQAQRDLLADLRARRDNETVAALRGRLDTAARGSENLLPLLVECVEHEVTLGEICHTLRAVFGEYRPDARI